MLKTDEITKHSVQSSKNKLEGRILTDLRSSRRQKLCDMRNSTGLKLSTESDAVVPNSDTFLEESVKFSCCFPFCSFFCCSRVEKELSPVAGSEGLARSKHSGALLFFKNSILLWNKKKNQSRNIEAGMQKCLQLHTHENVTKASCFFNIEDSLNNKSWISKLLNHMETKDCENTGTFAKKFSRGRIPGVLSVFERKFVPALLEIFTSRALKGHQPALSWLSDWLKVMAASDVAQPPVIPIIFFVEGPEKQSSLQDTSENASLDELLQLVIPTW